MIENRHADVDLVASPSELFDAAKRKLDPDLAFLGVSNVRTHDMKDASAFAFWRQRDVAVLEEI